LELKDLKKYKKNYLILEDFKFNEFERIELLIFLIRYLDISSSVEDYYLILGGRGLITRHYFNNVDYLIQNARILLKTLNQMKVFNDELAKYEKADIEKLYVRDKNKFVKSEGLSRKIEIREELYLKLLSLEIKYTIKPNNYAFQDYKKYAVIIGDKECEINLDDKINPIKLNECSSKSKKKIKIKIEDLVKEAKEIDKILSKKQPYREKIIKNSLFKRLNKVKFEKSEIIEFDNITNIIGQVGSGKTTFSDAIIRNLIKEKKRIMIIEPTVKKVLKRSDELEKIGIKSVPIIGNSSWYEHIEKSSDVLDFLDDYDSKILTSGCILGGHINEYDLVVEYGKEPCEKIYGYYEKGENKGKLNKNTKYKCPWYYACPRTKIQRKIINSDVIVTTTAGLINTSIGISGITIFEHTLNNIDLVIVDEAESELQKADTMFAPIISYDEYIRSNGSIGWEYYKKTSNERTDKSKKDTRNFIAFHSASDIVFIKIHQILKNNKQGVAKSNLKAPFTGNILIKTCKEKKLLNENAVKLLSNMVGKKIKRIYEDFMASIIEIGNRNDLFEYLDEYDFQIEKDLTDNQVNIIIFIISVLYFENLYRKISNLVQGNEELPMSTKQIVSQRFEFQQRYIPVSPKGNIFALQYKESEINGEADLYIVKQFAMGRAMYLRFPWLKLDYDGNPLGPNVLLLSGSSFAPLSLANHIDEQVNYIIEAEDYKRDYISRSCFEYIDTGFAVSGAGKKRDENLRKVIAECKELIIDKLEENKNLLMIVNSYDDVKVVNSKLKSILENTHYKDEISYLVSDSEEESEGKIKQSNVSKFSDKNSRILIAPAILIERGHNIVDRKGNSAFDALMFLTRPMSNPKDYKSHVAKVNGLIMTEYSNSNYLIDTEVYKDMRKKANSKYYNLESDVESIDNLPLELQDDIVVTQFVMMLQIFGRLCRIGDEKDLKSSSPEVYFLDAAFKSKSEDRFDLLNRLVDYLDNLMSSESIKGEIAKTLYESFYIALKRGKNIYGKR
jgi:Type II/IV secretion system protein.